MSVTLVSGGTGYVGRFIVEALLAAGDEVVVSGRTAPARGVYSESVRFLPGSLEPDRIDPAQFAGIDRFVHAAFDHAPGRYRGGEADDPKGFVRRNRDGSIALFRAAKAAGVARAVFLSSRAVYGPKAAGESLTEETPAAPDTLYGRVKLDVEEALCGLADETFAPVSLRATGVYGPAEAGRAHKWTELFDAYLAGRAVSPRVGTEVHGADLARAALIALEAEAAPMLNVSDLLLDRHDLLALVKAATGSPHAPPARADATSVNAMDCSRLAALGWVPGGRPLLERTVRGLIGR